MMWSNRGDWSAANWVAMCIMMIVFWAVLIGLAIWLIRRGRLNRASGPASAGGRTPPPAQVLGAPPAHGKIDQEQSPVAAASFTQAMADQNDDRRL